MVKLALRSSLYFLSFGFWDINYGVLLFTRFKHLSIKVHWLSCTLPGKCFKLQGDIKEERRIIMSSMNVVVARSTFHEQDLSTLYVDSLLRKNVIADAFGVQNASILYNICCFSLEHKDTRYYLTEYFTFYFFEIMALIFPPFYSLTMWVKNGPITHRKCLALVQLFVWQICTVWLYICLESGSRHLWLNLDRKIF